MLEKPKDCNCNWPKTRYRNGSGHYTTCPVHQRFLKNKGHLLADLYSVTPKPGTNLHIMGEQGEILATITKTGNCLQITFDYENPKITTEFVDNYFVVKATF